jgi:hypothetical protein
LTEEIARRLGGETVAAEGYAQAESVEPTAGIAAEDIKTDATVYGMSPTIDRLEPGDEIRFDIGLVAVPRRHKMDEAIDNATKTYAGDGTHLFLPPPVAMTPRVIWGEYRQVAGEGDLYVIDIDDNSDDPVTTQRLSYFSGMNAGSVEEYETRPGREQLALRGEVAVRLFQGNERVTLKGRLDTGEFFELVLRPGESQNARSMRASREAELYWKTPGKLTQDLLHGSPNPFRDATTVFFEIPSVIEEEDGTQLRFDGSVDTSVKVYDVTGRLVSVLVDSYLSTGTHTTRWRAVDEQGNPVASGAYFVKLAIGKKFITKRLILLK